MDSETSVDDPPITPPIPIGRSSPSQIRQSRQIVSGTDRSSGHGPLDPVESHDGLSGASCPRAQRLTGDPVEVVRVGRLSELEHDVVRGVDDVVKRPHTGEGQPAGDDRL